MSLAIPGQMQIETNYAPGPLAQPLMLTLNTPTGPKVLALGGLTKVEQLAGMIGNAFSEGCAANGRAEQLKAWAADVVDMAEAILAECERRAQAKQSKETTP